MNIKNKNTVIDRRLRVKPAMTLMFLVLFCFSAFAQKKTTKPQTAVAHEELANAAFDDYRFEEAVQHFEAFLDTKPNDSIADAVKEKLAKARIGQRMMRGVADIVFIDSTQVDKADFLTAYHLDRQNGSLFSPGNFQTGFLTERGILKYFSDQNKNGDLDLFRSAKLANEWESAAPLSERINTAANENFPFVTADGITLYFASDGEESLGGYDIFMSRFQPSANDYLQPENMGMPFNSPFNDYLLVIDEVQGIGRFASDRFQPEGKVVVYTFIPNAFIKIIDTEKQDSLRERASLRNIHLQPAKRPTPVPTLQISEKQTVSEFEFWVNDQTVYHFLSDFQSDAARKFFVQAQEEEKKTEAMRFQLENLRRDYDNASATDKSLIEKKITELEKESERQMSRPFDFYRQAQEVENKKITGK